jgi:hypothetical protein
MDVGYLITAPKASLIYEKPVSLRSRRVKALSQRAVQACPAVNDFERKTFEIPVPYNIRLRCTKNEKEFMSEAISPGTRLDEDLIRDHVFLMEPDFWRDPNIPVLQMKCPYLFICDEEAYLTQSPPFLDYKRDRWPGLVVTGRFQFDVWPRVLSWAFEWYDLSKDLILRKGEPWFYVMFEGSKPSESIELLEAIDTPDLQKYRASLEDVVKFVSNPFSLKDRARERRPEKLLRVADA